MSEGKEEQASAPSHETSGVRTPPSDSSGRKWRKRRRSRAAATPTTAAPRNRKPAGSPEARADHTAASHAQSPTNRRINKQQGGKGSVGRRGRSNSASQNNSNLKRAPPAAEATVTPVPARRSVAVSTFVRCVAADGLFTTKSLKDLLRQGMASTSQTEADTPVLGPCAPPGMAEQQEGPTAAAKVSPMLAFTLDSIATPNTFATFGDAANLMVKPHSAEDLHRLDHTAGSPRGDAEADDPTLFLPPPITVESCYQYIQRNFVNNTFQYYETQEGRSTFYEKCEILCDQVGAILAQEPLMGCIAAPVYVFGDIHGNFADLTYFLRSVLPFNDIHLSPCNILCLGDYVDRGPFSLECVMLLFALKIEAPQKLTLLRGNHEDRVVCGDRRTYGVDCFLAQCQSLFGPVLGLSLFNKVTSVFRHLPLAAEILVPHAPNTRNLTPVGSTTGMTSGQWKRATDQRVNSHAERILCTHGGIPRFNAPPREKDMLAFLRSPKFPRLLTLFPNNPFVKNDPLANATHGGPNDDVPLTEEEVQKSWFVAFDLMWSDPTIDDSSVQLNEWGFGFNSRGNNVVSFSAKAVETFLEAFHYSMLFRAHQEKAHGIRLSKSQQVLTIFSSSNYLGHGNGAGCVVVSPQGDVQLIVKNS